MYWADALFPWVTWTGRDQCCPSADEVSSTASRVPGPLAFHTVNSRPVAGSAVVRGRQQRMSAGPPPTLCTTTDLPLPVAPPSCEVRVTSETPLPAGAGRAASCVTAVSAPPVTLWLPKNM